MWIALNPGFQFEEYDEHLICGICGKHVERGGSGAYYENSKTREILLVAHQCNRSPKLNED